MILTGRDVRWYVENNLLKFEPSLKDEQFQQNGIDLVLGDCRVPRIRKGDFCLGCTKEKITMPVDLMAFVALRSTWARCGLTFLGGTIIDAGFIGTITLEIGSFTDIDLPIGQRFIHLVFSKLSNPSVAYKGKYQNQSGIQSPIMDK